MLFLPSTSNFGRSGEGELFEVAVAILQSMKDITEDEKPPAEEGGMKG